MLTTYVYILTTYLLIIILISNLKINSISHLTEFATSLTINIKQLNTKLNNHILNIQPHTDDKKFIYMNNKKYKNLNQKNKPSKKTDRTLTWVVKKIDLNPNNYSSLDNPEISQNPQKTIEKTYTENIDIERRKKSTITKTSNNQNIPTKNKIKIDKKKKKIIYNTQQEEIPHIPNKAEIKHPIADVYKHLQEAKNRAKLEHPIRHELNSNYIWHVLDTLYRRLKLLIRALLETRSDQELRYMLIAKYGSQYNRSGIRSIQTLTREELIDSLVGFATISTKTWSLMITAALFFNWFKWKMSIQYLNSRPNLNHINNPIIDKSIIAQIVMNANRNVPQFILQRFHNARTAQQTERIVTYVWNLIRRRFR